MNRRIFRFCFVILFITLVSHASFAQSNFKGPVYEVKVQALDSTANFKLLVTAIRNSPEVDYCRVADAQDGLVIQTKENLTYEEINALINESGFSLMGDVRNSKGLRMHSNGEISQPDQNE